MNAYKLTLKHKENETEAPEYTLRLTAKNQVELAKQSGLSVLQGMGQMSTGNIAWYFCHLLWQSAQTFHHGFTLDKAFSVYDDMVDRGYLMSDFLNIAQEIIGVSGFFGKADSEVILDEANKQMVAEIVQDMINPK